MFKKILALLVFLPVVVFAGTSRDFPGSAQRIKELSNVGMWQDFYSELQPLSKTYCYVMEFSTFDRNDWVITDTGASAPKVLDERGGILSMLSGAVENDGLNIQLGRSDNDTSFGESFAPAVGKNLWFEARIAGNDVDQNDFFVGLHDSDNTIVAGRGVDYIGFSIDDGDANLDVATAASSTASTDLAITTMADDTYAKIGFKVSGTSKVEFYVNDVLESTLSSNVPTGLMRPSLAALTGEAAANALYVDYIVVCQDR